MARKNFYLWGSWGPRIIKKPFLTQKVDGAIKKVVLGDSCLIALLETGAVVSWGDDKGGCLGLGDDRKSQSEPRMVHNINGKVVDIQFGQHHVLALTEHGGVYSWGRNEQGQLGVGDTKDHSEPQFVADLEDFRVHQIATLRNSSFALTTTGDVYAWGNNKDGELGLNHTEEVVQLPAQVKELLPQRIKALEVFQGQTIIAHVDNTSTPDDAIVLEDDGEEADVAEAGKDQDDEEMNIFKGVDLMRKVMEKTQEWWNYLLNIRHGRPYDLDMKSGDMAVLGIGDKLGMELDTSVPLGDLKKADMHLDQLIDSAIVELKRTQGTPGTRNVKFMLSMFIDDCRLRREKVQRTLSARSLSDSKIRITEISGFSVCDFGSNANEEIKKIIAVTDQLQQTLDAVRRIATNDVMSRELQLSMIECLETRLQLHDTQVELLKAAEMRPSDPMLPPLRIIKDRWNTLKHFSLYALYQECEQRKLTFTSDDEYLAYLVQASDRQIDQVLQMDRDVIVTRDTLVPALCYDLLKENAELRKMTNSYQLHVLLLHQGKSLANVPAAKGKAGEGAAGGG